MRVLVVNVHFAPDSYGGATVIAEENVQHLAATGHEVVVVTGTDDRRVPHGNMVRYSALGVPVVALGLGRETDTAAQYRDGLTTRRFVEILATVRPDVVHFHAVQRLGVGCVEAALDADIATVVTLHDAWWFCERQFMVRPNGEFCGQVAIQADVCSTCIADADAHEQRQMSSREILNRCQAVLVPSDFWRTVMVGSGVYSEIVRVNRNGVTMPREGFQRTPYEGPVRFGFVGGRGQIKGRDQLLAALRSLDRSDYLLRVVDTTTNLGRSSMAAHHFNVPGEVQIVPGYRRAGLDDFFDSIDVLLFPSQWRESFGLTVREATLRGVWCVVTDSGGTVEDIVDGVNGTVIPLDGGYEHLAAAVGRILAHPDGFVPDPAAAVAIRTPRQQADELAGILSEVAARQREMRHES